MKEPITWQEVEAAGYRIHNTGWIENKKTGEEAPTHLIKGAYNVCVYLPRQEGKSKPWVYVRLHRMVAAKYIPNPENHPQVLVVRGSSCRVNNLRWVPHNEKRNHIPEGIKNEKQKRASKRREGMYLLEFEGLPWREAWLTYGVNRTTAYNVWRKLNLNKVKNNATI